MPTASLDWLNRSPESHARALLLECCGSSAWAARMLAARPFASVAALLHAADRAWADLDRADRLEAFGAHPRIGERPADDERLAARWSTAEQSAAARASEAVRRALADANAEYERKFGHIFIVSATGKSAGEMRHLLRVRMANDPAMEFEVASDEQRRIMRLRLEKLLARQVVGNDIAEGRV